MNQELVGIILALSFSGLILTYWSMVRWYTRWRYRHPFLWKGLRENALKATPDAKVGVEDTILCIICKYSPSVAIHDHVIVSTPTIKFIPLPLQHSSRPLMAASPMKGHKRRKGYEDNKRRRWMWQRRRVCMKVFFLAVFFCCSANDIY